jgi:hypothetical protein
MADYDLDEAKDIFARAEESFVLDNDGRRAALLTLVEQLMTISTPTMTIKPREREDGFVFGLRGKGSIAFFLYDDSTLAILPPSTSTNAKTIEGLEYNPTTKLFEGAVKKGDLNWPKERRSAAAVVVEQLVAALKTRVADNAKAT